MKRHVYAVFDNAAEAQNAVTRAAQIGCRVSAVNISTEGRGTAGPDSVAGYAGYAGYTPANGYGMYGSSYGTPGSTYGVAPLPLTSAAHHDAFPTERQDGKAVLSCKVAAEHVALFRHVLRDAQAIKIAGI